MSNPQHFVEIFIKQVLFVQASPSFYSRIVFLKPLQALQRVYLLSLSKLNRVVFDPSLSKLTMTSNGSGYKVQYIEFVFEHSH